MTKEEIRRYAGANMFSNYHHFYKWIVGTKKDYKVFAEVGVWKGDGVSYLANLLKSTGKDFEIYAIDLFDKLWKYKDYETRYAGYHIKYMSEMYQYNLEKTETRDFITDVKGYSDKVAHQFEDDFFDSVFIDADHEYEPMEKDLEAWLPKVKKGGILAGHDYVQSQQGVIKAVDQSFGGKKKIHQGYVWYYEK